MKYIGELVTGDFGDNTMTFEIEGEMKLQAGKYSIYQIQEGNQVNNPDIPYLSEQRELLLAFAEYLYEAHDKEVEERIVDDYLNSK
ncbi:MAG: hypothetical protein AAF348_18790 [Bacteroidota bacterium]